MAPQQLFANQSAFESYVEGINQHGNPDMQDFLVRMVMESPALFDAVSKPDANGKRLFDTASISPSTNKKLMLVLQWLDDSFDNFVGWRDQPNINNVPIDSDAAFDATLAAATSHYWNGRTPKSTAFSDAPLKTEGGMTLPTDYPLNPEQIRTILGRTLTSGASIEAEVKNGDRSRIEYTVKDEEGTGLESAKWSHNLATDTVEFTGWNYTAAAQGKGGMQKLMADRLTLAEKLGVARMTSNFLEGGAYAFARVGFLPTREQWDSVRKTAAKKLKTAVQKKTVPLDVATETQKLLDSEDPRSIWQLSDLRHKAGDVPIGRHLLSDNGWKGTLDLHDEEQMTRFKNYIGTSELDASAKNAAHIGQVPDTQGMAMPKRPKHDI